MSRISPTHSSNSLLSGHIDSDLMAAAVAELSEIRAAAAAADMANIRSRMVDPIQRVSCLVR